MGIFGLIGDQIYLKGLKEGNLLKLEVARYFFPFEREILIGPAQFYCGCVQRLYHGNNSSQQQITDTCGWNQMLKVCVLVCALFVIVSTHAITLFDTVLVIPTQIVVNVVAYFTQQLLIVFDTAVLCNQTFQVSSAVVSHSAVCVRCPTCLAVHRCCDLF